MNNVVSDHADELASWGLGEYGDGTSQYDGPKYTHSSSPAQYEPVIKYGPGPPPPPSSPYAEKYVKRVDDNHVSNDRDFFTLDGPLRSFTRSYRIFPSVTISRRFYRRPVVQFYRVPVRSVYPRVDGDIPVGRFFFRFLTGTGDFRRLTAHSLTPKHFPASGFSYTLF